MARILMVSTYPIKKPQHGGQKRVAAIAAQYKKAGHVVRHVAIYIKGSQMDVASTDIATSLKKYRTHPLASLIGDVLVADVLQEDPIVRREFTRLLHGFRPDIIEVEQVFLYRTVKTLLDEIMYQALTVNSTQNIEADLKRDILLSFGVDSKQASQAVEQIKTLEAYAAKYADWTVACTDSDADKLRRMGAREVLVSANGISKEKVDPADVSRLRDKFRQQGVHKISLYIGSAHPPNLTGYIELVGSRLGFMDESSRLVVVGGISDMIYSYALQLPNYLKPLFLEKVVFMGRVEESTLSALLHIADQIILPILEGGGSNLKTAEAILADKQVVATSKSFHSYEKFLALPNVLVADTSDDFIAAMSEQLAQTKKQRSSSDHALAKGVLWENTLKQMVERTLV